MMVVLRDLYDAFAWRAGDNRAGALDRPADRLQPLPHPARRRRLRRRHHRRAGRASWRSSTGADARTCSTGGVADARPVDWRPSGWRPRWCWAADGGDGRPRVPGEQRRAVRPSAARFRVAAYRAAVVDPAAGRPGPGAAGAAWGAIEGYTQPQAAAGRPLYPGAVLSYGHEGKVVLTRATGYSRLYADGAGTLLPEADADRDPDRHDLRPRLGLEAVHLRSSSCSRSRRPGRPRRPGGALRAGVQRAIAPVRQERASPSASCSPTPRASPPSCRSGATTPTRPRGCRRRSPRTDRPSPAPATCTAT